MERSLSIYTVSTSFFPLETSRTMNPTKKVVCVCLVLGGCGVGWVGRGNLTYVGFRFFCIINDEMDASENQIKFQAYIYLAPWNISGVLSHVKIVFELVFL